MSYSVTVGTTPTLLAPAKAASLRGSVLLEVPAGGQRVFIGDVNVTPSTGNALEPTASNASTMLIENELASKPATPAWYGIVESGTQAVKVMEGPP